MAISQNFPNTRPSLNLNFASTKRLDPRITFTRTSTGTYVGSDGLIKTAGINEARFDHNPTTGESLGLLIEESRTNSWTFSEQLANAAWTKTDTTVTANAATAPDGTITASKVISTATTAVHSISRIKPTVSPAWVTVFLKAAEYTVCDVYDVNIDTGLRINLLTGVLSESPAFVGKFRSGRYNVNSVGNGWFRVQIGFANSDSTNNNPVHIYPNGAQSYLGDGTSGIFVWGAQLEAGAFPTSYIPTTSSTVTRSADVASITGANFSSWYNQSEGTMFAQMINGLEVLNSGSNTAYIAISNGVPLNASSVGDGIKYGSGSPGTYTRTFIITSGSAVLDGNTSTNPKKVAIANQQNNFAVIGDGTIITTSTSGNVPTGMNTFTLLSNGRTSYARLTYWPRRLSNTELQNLTK